MNKKKNICILICLIFIIFSVGMTIYQKTKLTYQEMSTLTCVQDLKHITKDKQSFKLEDDVLVLNYSVEDEDGIERFYKFSYIKYKENNTSKCAVYDFEEYLGEYDDEINPYDIDYNNKTEVEKTVKLSYAKTAFSEYTIGELNSNLVHFVKKNRIEKKIK